MSEDPAQSPDCTVTPTAAEPAVVFTSYDASTLAVAKSLLQSAEIEYGVVGEGVQDLFAWGRFPSGGNIFMGPIKLLVAADDREDALAVLSVIAPAAEPCEPLAPEDGDSAVSSRRSPSAARTLGKWVAAIILGWWLVQVLMMLLER